MSSPCHIELILTEQEAPVPKAAETGASRKVKALKKKAAAQQ